ncbi:MAG TPA: DapH/DapD/GlmU-related protein [Sphingomonadaceae bacterium]|nr:DapH/DapD/GlmU-related protein [Sphingomonadaceae bacterium]
MNATSSNYGIRQAGEESSPFDRAPSFTLRHRIFRLVWQAAWLLLAAWTPPPMHRWRIFIANLFGAKIHPTGFLYGSVRIWYPPHLTMGERATLGPGVNCYSMAPISVGDYAVVSQGVFLCTGTHNFRSPEFQILARPISIGTRCWICAEAFVGPGVSIGDGAVLAARGAAFRDLDAWTVYQGNPAVAKSTRDPI